MPDNIASPFIARPLVRERTLTLIYSPHGGTNGSVLAQILAMHVAAGIDVYNLDFPERRPVIYLGLCGRSMRVYDLKKAWCEKIDPEGKVLSKATFQFLQSSQPANLRSEKARKALIDWIEGRDATFQKGGAAPLGLIVIDPLRNALPRGRLTHEHVIESALAFVREVWERGIRAAIFFVVEGDRQSDLPNCHDSLGDAADVLLRTAIEGAAISMKIVAARDVPAPFQAAFNRAYGSKV